MRTTKSEKYLTKQPNAVCSRLLSGKTSITDMVMLLPLDYKQAVIRVRVIGIVFNYRDCQVRVVPLEGVRMPRKGQKIRSG